MAYHHFLEYLNFPYPSQCGDSCCQPETVVGAHGYQLSHVHVMCIIIHTVIIWQNSCNNEHLQAFASQSCTVKGPLTQFSTMD